MTYKQKEIIGDATLYLGDSLKTLYILNPESVQCVITSPPYWGLRDYGVDGQMGLEDTPEAYIKAMVSVFHEVWRVLKPDGTLWLNMGDCYSSGGHGGHDVERKTGKFHGHKERIGDKIPKKAPRGYKPKDLVGIPWMLAFALRNDGWYLRSDIIWVKPNPMPESVTDRPTRAHEYIFLLTKSKNYYYDADSIREPQKDESVERYNRARNPVGQRGFPGNEQGLHKMCNKMNGISALDYDERKMVDRTDGRSGPPMTNKHRTYHNLGRNKRSVWDIATYPNPEAHFATFPPELITPCVLAGARAGDIILDPFMGSGTTGIVCHELNRHFQGIELNPEYFAMSCKRIIQANKQLKLFKV